MRPWVRPRLPRFIARRILTGCILAGPFRVVFGLCAVSFIPLVYAVPASGAVVQDSPAEAQRTVWDGVYTEAQAERGRAAYISDCSGCHAADLRGDNNSPSLIGMSFTFLWGGSTLGALYERVREIMPPERPGSLSAAAYRDVLAFVLASNNYPNGQHELESGDLDHILISDQPDAEP